MTQAKKKNVTHLINEHMLMPATEKKHRWCTEHRGMVLHVVASGDVNECVEGGRKQMNTCVYVFRESCCYVCLFVGLLRTCVVITLHSLCCLETSRSLFESSHRQKLVSISTCRGGGAPVSYRMVNTCLRGLGDPSATGYCPGLWWAQSFVGKTPGSLAHGFWSPP